MPNTKFSDSSSTYAYFPLCSTLDHYEAALRVVIYLENSQVQDILKCTVNPLTLSVWCDSYWVACPMTRRSFSCWLTERK